MADAQTTRTADNLADRIARLATAARGLSRSLNTILAEEGLREDHWRVMHLLAQSHGLLMGEIAQSLVLPPATTTRIVDDLTDSGLVFRRPAPDDGRKAVAYLSRTGHETYTRTLSLVAARTAELSAFLRTEIRAGS